jgi:hypothetical protein
MSEQGEASGAPPVFQEFKDLVRIHLKQILKLDQHTSKVPMHTVALLVMIAYEALARFTDPAPNRPTHWLFAKRHQDLYGIDPTIGDRIFNAIRNGLAHTYRAYPIPIQNVGEVRLVLTWKDGTHAHLKAVASKMVNGQQWLCPVPRGSSELPQVVCVDVWSLWRDLDALFAEVEATLTTDPGAAQQFEALVEKNREHYTDKLKHGDPDLWRSFLFSRRLEEDAATPGTPQ